MQELITYATESRSTKDSPASQEAASSQFPSHSEQVARALSSSNSSNSSKPALTFKPKEHEVINLISDDEDDEDRMKELERLLSSSQEKKAAYGLCFLRVLTVLICDIGNRKLLYDCSSRRQCCLQTPRQRPMTITMKMCAPIYQVVA